MSLIYNTQKQQFTTQREISKLSSQQLQVFQQMKEEIHQIKLIKSINTQQQINYYYKDGIILNILIQKQFKLQDAKISWQKLTNWLLENDAHLITHQDVQNELKSDAACFVTKDLNDTPCLLVKVKTRIPGKIDIKETEKFFIYLYNEWYKHSEVSKTGKCSILWDREGFTRKNHDNNIAELMKNISSNLQDSMMSRLDKIYILHPNWFFKMLFTLFKVFISEQLKPKLIMVSKISQMSKYFNRQDLLKSHGGDFEFQFKYQREILGQDGSTPILYYQQKYRNIIENLDNIQNNTNNEIQNTQKNDQIQITNNEQTQKNTYSGESFEDCQNLEVQKILTNKTPFLKQHLSQSLDQINENKKKLKKFEYQEFQQECDTMDIPHEFSNHKNNNLIEQNTDVHYRQYRSISQNNYENQKKQELLENLQKSGIKQIKLSNLPQITQFN